MQQCMCPKACKSIGTQRGNRNVKSGSGKIILQLYQDKPIFRFEKYK